MIAIIIVAVLLTVITTFLAYFKWCMQYWNRKGLNNIPGTIPFGVLENTVKQKETIGITHKGIYHAMRAKRWRHGGIYIFAKPMYFVLNLEYLKNVLTKDFQYFDDRGFYHNEKVDPLSAHLLAIGGTKWKNLRDKLTPTFTSGKMKMMFPTLVECLAPLLETVEEHNRNDAPLDIKELFGCFTTNIIGSCAFGLECNTFKEPNSPFRVYGKKVFKMNKFQQLKFVFSMHFTELARFLKIVILEKDTNDFFFDVVRKTVEYREKNDSRRLDFMQLLIDMKKKSEEEVNENGTTLTFDEIVAQAFVFLLAGFETSSTTMTFALYEMASNQDVQNKVREEVKRVVAKHGGEITYEALHEMKYMGQVIDETLRKYPPVPFITRECVKDYKVPDADLVIEKGTRVGISILGIHHDPEYYPEPEKFDPERFSDENKQNRNQYAYIPFGEGPRLCIGFRFALMQIKMALAALLKSYNFTVDPKTEEPLQFDVETFVLIAKGHISLIANKI